MHSALRPQTHARAMLVLRHPPPPRISAAVASKHQHTGASVAAAPKQHQQQQQLQELEAALDTEVAGGTRTQLLLLSCVALVWAGDAAEVMSLAYLGPATSCGFGFGSTPGSQSALASAVFVGMLLGAASWGLLADELGRRRALLASTAMVVAAGLASSAAPSPTLLLLCRACVGFGLAGAPVAFTLLMELLPAASRTLFGVLIELAWTVGTIAEAGLAWAVLNTQGWRVLLLLSTGPLVLLLVLLSWLPESSRFLLARGDALGAAAVLQGMASFNGRAGTLHLPHLTGFSPPTAAAAEAASSSPAARVTAAAPMVEEQQQQRRRKHTCLPPPLEVASPESDRAALLPSPASSSSSSTASPLTPSRQHSQHHHPQQQQQHHHHHHHHHHHSIDPRRLAADVQHALATLWAGPHAASTTLLMFSWACVACVYYGLVQLDSQLHIAQAAGGAGGGSAASSACVDGRLQVPGADYAAVMLTAAAEVPAVAWAAAASKRAGAKTALVASLALGFACILPPIIVSVVHVSGAEPAAAAAAAGGTADSWSSIVTEASMFGSRLFVSAAFSLLWVFSPSHFPTRVRSFGLGISNACGRLGGLLSPFIVVNLSSAASPAAAEALLAVLCVAAAGAVWLTPHGAASAEHQLDENEGDA